MQIIKKANSIWIYFFIVKLFYTLFSIFIYSKLTPLGDSGLYLNPPRYDFNLLNSTELMFGVAGNLNIIVGPVITHILFMILSYYGIYKALSSLKLNNKALLLFLALFSLPSFGIWTSIVSKESVMIFATGILFYNIVNQYEKNTLIFKSASFYFSIYLILLFKPQYLISIIFFITTIKIYSHSKFYSICFIFMCYLIFITINYVYIDDINNLSLVFNKYFDSMAGSARPNFWIENYDFYTKILEGIYLAFMGPSINEVIDRPMYLPFYIESFAIVLFIFYIIIKSKVKHSIYRLLISFSISFIFLFFHYPFGILNIGAAIRYREGFLMILILLIYFIYYKLNNNLKKRITI